MDSVLYIKSKMIMRIFLIVHGSFEECFYRDVRNVGHRRKREFTLSQVILLHRLLRGQTFSVSRLGNFITVVPSFSSLSFFDNLPIHIYTLLVRE